MTKRKAIEAAIEYGTRENFVVRIGNDFYFQGTASAAFEYGRIAGLREAAKITKGSMAFGDIKILDRAETLAKKARAK